MPHCMLRSRDTRIDCGANVLASSACAPNRIIVSGPHRNAVTRSGCNVQSAQRFGDEPGLTEPALNRDVDGHVHLEARILLPAGQFR